LLRLFKNAPGIVDTNPIKAVTAAVNKQIIDMHAVSRCLHVSLICLLLYQSVGDNKVKTQEVRKKVERLLDGKKMLRGDVPEAAKEVLNAFKE
jgi:hypothetical protein